MQVKTSGIVFHSIKHTDSATIITVYTRQFGRVSYIAHGINKKKSICRAAFLQPLSIVEMEVSHSQGKNVQSIKEMRMEHQFNSIPYDPVKNSLALFLSEVFFRTLRQTEPDENLYLFLENSILQLDCIETGISNFHLVFLLKFTRFLGFEPNVDFVESNYFDLMNGVFLNRKPLHAHFLLPEISADFISLLKSDYTSMNNLSFTRPRRAEILRNIVDYYKLHIADFQGLHSLPVLQSLFD